MKIDNSLIVNLDDAIFYFEAPTYKDSLVLRGVGEKNEAEKLEAMLVAMASRLRRVENLVDSEDKQIGPERIRELDLDVGTLVRLFNAWSAEIASKFGGEKKEGAEKNDQSS